VLFVVRVLLVVASFLITECIAFNFDLKLEKLQITPNVLLMKITNDYVVDSTKKKELTNLINLHTTKNVYKQVKIDHFIDK
jgi:hypothetical protein